MCEKCNKDSDALSFYKKYLFHHPQVVIPPFLQYSMYAVKVNFIELHDYVQRRDPLDIANN